MSKILIVAKSSNGVIGYQNKIPWKLSDDLKRFKFLTMGRYILMGRKTFESIGKPLPGRKTIVVTSQNLNLKGVEVVNSIEEGFEIVGEDVVYIVGGQNIYQQTIHLCDYLYITDIYKEFEGDTFFPEFKEEDFKVYQQNIVKGVEFDYQYKTYSRILK